MSLRLIVGAVLLWSAALAAAPVTEEDPSGVTALRSDHQSALTLVKNGDAELLAERFQPALTLFDRAAVDAPANELIQRKRCQALAGLGKRSDAIAACEEAIRYSSAPALNLRTKVGVIMTGARLPSPAEAGEAYASAELARDSAPREPWGYAAFSIIGERLGDPVIWARALERLQEWAPNHYETTAALQRAAGMQHQWQRKLAVWGLLAIAILVTLGHAVWQRRQPAPSVTGLTPTRDL